MEEIRTKLDFIRDAIDLHADPTWEGGKKMLDKLGTLMGYTGHAAKLVAEAEELYKNAIVNEYTRHFEDEVKVPSTIYSKVLEASVAKESALHTYASGISSALKTSIDGLRTIISYHKNNNNELQ